MSAHCSYLKGDFLMFKKLLSCFFFLLTNLLAANEETQHQVTIDGEIINYTATAGNLLLTDEKTGQPKASIFFISYTKNIEDGSSQRPITFCFNGGPGSSSVWLHVGAFGPKRVNLTDLGEPSLPPTLIDNEYSLLDLTDLVFIDPVSTGYSKAIATEDTKKYFTVEEDIKSIGEFIHQYINHCNRWNAPLFIAGESYGTTRAIGVASYLYDHHFISVNGLVLISSLINYQPIKSHIGNDLSYLMYLPSYTATAWYHQKLPPDLQTDFSKAIQESQDFVNHAYALALLKGSSITASEKNEIIIKMARLTGLSTHSIAKNHLRINPHNFMKELLQKENKVLGRLDSRYTGENLGKLGKMGKYDPCKNAISNAFTITFNQYIKSELNYYKDDAYKISANLVQQWDYCAKNKYLNVSDKLIKLLKLNPKLRLFFANGYYDLATPFSATKYNINHLELDYSLEQNFILEFYEAGHMMYLHKPSLIKLKKDLSNYYNLNSLAILDAIK